MAKIMIQGTGSTVGKSILTAALCRIFKQDGYSVVPFKAQNMSLNSYITLDGKEMGRAQVLQAYAAGLEPEAYMNPILLKPTGDKNSQVIVNGKVYGNYTAVEYHELKPVFKDMLKEQFEELENKFDIVVIEGAGSPAEINLRENDIVNMGFAELVDAPVLLAGDIDKGGVFASLAGTMILLKENERKRVKGTIINKFRGDIEILKPGLDMIYDVIKVPCVGVVPYFNLQLEDEDGAVTFNKEKKAPIDIAVIKLPHISNFTDLDSLGIEEDVSIRYITRAEEFKNPDLLIIPGSKNTIEDLLSIRNEGIEEKIINYSKEGRIIGICGGYQMLGNTIKDPLHTETKLDEIQGMNLLNVDTIMQAEKVMTRTKAGFSLNFKEIMNISEEEKSVYGYEIHMGDTFYGDNTKYLLDIVEKNSEDFTSKDGALNDKGNIMGTYLHGIFDSIDFRETILNEIRVEKGLQTKKSKTYESLRETELDKLADLVRKSLDMKEIYKIVFNR
ncbi:cobyric acid synthase [Clostridium grantii]|uniref:Cobyric acid synthase n=1 Tax=Clostridium grantii DSM 8605 TaxID=1121316 RepID=A0A1M5UT98_9CLOT|nr:cobyric acid synthase [Clostridium grantii]SHH66165.1 adenosylcobyric acid synthase (glutamine-hydrolysing) [Clostridium grantii DSM 8605]